MALRSKVFKVVLATAAGLVIGVGMQTEIEASGYRNLCDSAPSACEYAPSTAPQLNADVCYQLSTKTAKIMSGSCPTGWYPYYVEAGEVIEPMTGVVQAYIALPDACALGYCLPHDPNDPGGEEGAVCCGSTEEPEGCIQDVAGCDGEILYCFDGEEGGGVAGSWECQESE
jgi:hypothetical protein